MDWLELSGLTVFMAGLYTGVPTQLRMHYAFVIAFG